VLAQTNKIITDTEETIQRIEELVPSQIALINIQKAQVTAETNQVNALVTTKLPKEVAQIEAQTSLLAYDLTNIKPVEKDNLVSTGLSINAQTAQITYTTSSVLPSQVSLTNAQTSSATAQTALYNQKTTTELAQTTTTPASGSVMGVQNDLMATQKASYLRDAEQKAAKMLIDTWSVRHNAEPGGNPVIATNRLRNEDIGDAVGKMLTGIGVV
jgi:hypothetical protein